MFEEKFSFSVFLEKLSKFFKKDNLKIIFSLVLALIGVAAILFGLLALLSESEIAACPDCQVKCLASDSAKSSLGSLTVDISGEVEHPGVYQLETGSRVAGLVEAAGGFTERADQEFVTQVLNLSERLEDEKKIYIPSQEERIKIEQLLKVGLNNSDQESNLESAQVAVQENTSLISINNASQADLESLPGIGEKRALQIIENRPFSKIDELEDLISENLLTEIRDLITL
ncbi:MAG: SLBB domain-containing protein [Candidatus Woesebacteria bacterium]|jgi:competence protein ComEA